MRKRSTKDGPWNDGTYRDVVQELREKVRENTEMFVSFSANLYR
jgi:hypothetical protein